MKRGIYLMILLSLILSPFTIYARSREGVDVPYQVTGQKLDIPDGQFLLYMYQLILNRNPDETGATNYMKLLDASQSRQTVFADLMQANEFTSNATLNSDANFVTRLYT